jgi:hypothetical protein
MTSADLGRTSAAELLSDLGYLGRPYRGRGAELRWSWAAVTVSSAAEVEQA